MTAHHQLDEVRDLLSLNQIVVFVGSTGTGKTLLGEQLEERLAQSGLKPLRLDATRVHSLSEMNAPVAELLGCDSLTLALPRGGLDRFRIIVDNAEEIADAGWRGEFQDQWRAFLMDQEHAGRVSAIFLGRPSFRDVLAGAGSPLMNIAAKPVARGMTEYELQAAFGVEDAAASIVIRKTGGHPLLSAQLTRELRETPDDVGDAVRRWEAAATDLVIRVVEDHGIGGRGLIIDLLNADGPVEEMALLRRRFAVDAARGLVCLEDLTKAGLLQKSGTGYEIKAAMLREIAEIGQRLDMPIPSVPIQEREEHARAAGLVYEIENRLRQLVVVSLAGGGDGWWSESVPPAIATEAEALWLKERGGAPGSARDLHPVMYLTMDQLYALLVGRRTWAALRTQANLDRSVFHGIWRQFVDVRNKVAHNRPASKVDILTLETVLERLNL